MAGKMDHETSKEWELFEKKGELATIEDLNKFMKQRCAALEKISEKVDNTLFEKNNEKRGNNMFKGKNKAHAYVTNVTGNDKTGCCCYFCKEDHTIFKCQEFLKLSANERIAAIKRQRLCYNCLQPSHSVQACTMSNCRKCGKRHNSLLHIEKKHDNSNSISSSNHDHVSKSSGVNNDGQKTSTSQIEAAPTTSSLHAVCDTTYLNYAASQVLLSTAVVHVKDSKGNLHQCRALLDSGSQSNFITKQLREKLNLQLKNANYSVVGVGQVINKVNSIIDLEMCSRNNTYNASISCLVLEKITDDLPTISFSRCAIKIPSYIQLADPSFYKSGPIDLLLGTTIFWELLCVGQFQLENSQLTIQKTRLGWVMAGGLCIKPTQQIRSINCLAIDNNVEENLDNNQLESQIVKFWQVEEVYNKSIQSKVEQHCENHFINNFKRDKDGRFIVKIPLKENIGNLGQSRQLAINRFHSLERKLLKNDQLRVEYSKFMSDYEQLGHMVKIKDEVDTNPSYYLPHHAIVREASITTKVRVVFDASMKTDSGLSLNDVQYVGPTVQSELYSIILRFRLHNYVMTADISKMYRMILIDPEQRGLQRIYWRSNQSNNLECYELKTVTYGTASAPYLATRCLYQLAIDNEKMYPIASDVIKNSFYVDDLLTGCNSKKNLLQLQHEITTILSSGGFELRKWLSNDGNLCSQFILNDNLEASVLSIGDNEANKTLGILWNARLDTIQYSTSNLGGNQIVTKRTILSAISQVYDPLGLLAPIVIVGKLLMQNLWQAKISWDEAVPQNVYTMWKQFRNNLPMLNQINISRQVTISDYNFIELHAFADASERAYGTCIYLKSGNESGQFITRLLTAKSRVAPIKQISLLRLELCSALLAARLANKVVNLLNININKLYFWSESKITLSWLQGCPTRWRTFVANRVSEIQDITRIDSWNHVSSKDNPADLLTRGLRVQDLKSSTLWWTGPDWLNQGNLRPQLTNIYIDSRDVPEQRTIANVAIKRDFDIFNRFSSIKRLQRVFAYVLRFISNIKLNHDLRQSGFLKCDELDSSLHALIRLSQEESFPDDYEQLLKNKPLNKRSNLLSLSPFLDNKSLLRVGGRLQNSDCDYNKKHPIILPHKHHLTKLILKGEHERLMHCGPTMLLASVRERFWPITGRNLARATVQQCIRCFHVKPHDSKNYLMGNLPACRVNQGVPFYNTGCDFAGPFLLKDRSTRTARGAKLIKGYVCLFICLATKAIHLEVVSDLTTENFLATLRRFIGRRGKPLNMYTDNATTFVGANAEMKNLQNFLKLHSDDINNNLSHELITWHFIPARSPNFGGIWEAGVKSAKFHLKRVIGEAHLDFEQFNTVLVQIEAILNSRPLCPLTATSDQLNPLTPAHFLLGKPITALPERQYINVPENRLKKFERLQKLVQHFWTRWNQEYLAELQTRHKWNKSTQNHIKIGTIVLVKEDNTPPLKWHMGRVTQLHPGQDGILRVVSVLVNGNVLKRAVSRLCVFPFEIEGEQCDSNCKQKD